MTRGRFRRVVAVLGVLPPPGCRCRRSAPARRPDDVRDVFRARSAWTAPDVDSSGWFWVAVAALPFAVGAGAGRRPAGVGRWPEMGRRYDAPADQEPRPKAPEEQENLDLWKAMDEGRDPTA